VDVVAVRADELEPADSGPGSGDDSRRPRRGIAATIVVLVVLGALVAAVTTLLVRAQSRGERNDAREAALQAAREEAVNLTTLSYKTAERDVDRILSGATGELRRQFAAQRPAETRVLSQTRSVSRGTVLAAGLVRMATDLETAQVVVATDATVTTETTPGSPESVLKHYRMVMGLERVDGRWLVSNVAFAGRPL
jgi:Mce-associated membrane protein